VIPSQKATRKRYALLAVAFLLLLLGGVGMYFGAHNFRIRALGVVAVMASTRFVLMSRDAVRSGLPEAKGRTIEPGTAGPGRWLWIVSLALVPLLGAALFLMLRDFVNRDYAAWPVSSFVGVALVCAMVWSHLAAKISVGRRGGPR
jgi:hypothetical protein